MSNKIKKRKILFVGGGSGGHVMPIIAILNELLSSKASVPLDLRIFTDRKYFSETSRQVNENLRPPVSEANVEYSLQTKVNWIASGKLRRYTNFTFWDYLTKPSLWLANFFDMWKLFFGFWQSLFMLIFWRPHAVFIKGGYVGVPVGLAARILCIPTILHESDAGGLGLANRILSRFARVIFTGAPIENYNASKKVKNKMRWIGIPLSDSFEFMRNRLLAGDEPDIPAEVSEAWEKGRENRTIVLAMGGSLGARRINEDLLLNIDKLHKSAFLVLISGVGQNYDDAKNLAAGQSNVLVLPFTDHPAELMAASQIIVARAGATTIAELEILMKPSILVPNAKLPGAHQTKNARVLADRGACLYIEDNIDNKELNIMASINSLIDNPKMQKQFSERIGKLAKVDAAKIIADKLLEVS